MSEPDAPQPDETEPAAEPEGTETEPQEAPDAPPETTFEAPSEDAPPEPEPEPEQVEPQGATPEQWDDRFKKSEKAFEAYMRKVTALYEEDATQLVPISISPGAPPGFIYLPDAGRVPDELKQPVMEFFGIAREQDYEPDPFTAACVTCSGKGATRTGSNVPGQEKRTCPSCAGKGFQVIGQPDGNGVADVPAGAVQGGPAPEDFPREDVDAWGEPRILPDGRPNPNFGRMPQFKELVEPWGVTANLTAQNVAAGEGA